ncbi:DUF5317 family protein [Streptomyces sp. SYSU K21746]
MAFAVLCVLPVVVGVVVGYGTGGRLFALAGSVRAAGLLWLAAGIQALQYYVHPVRRFFDDSLRIPLLWLVFGTGAAWLVVNLRTWSWVMRTGAALVLMGALANGAAVIANGRMPYAPEAAVALGKPAGVTTPKNEPANQDTKFAYLGDTMPVPVLAKIVSPGDLLIGIGIVVLVSTGMRGTGRVHKEVRDDGEDVPCLPAHGRPVRGR